jgi:hypothetical protein
VIVVALLKPRQQRHFFRIVYRDPNSPNPVMHVIVLEVPKRMSYTLEAVLDARAPQRSRSCNYWGCWRRSWLNPECMALGKLSQAQSFSHPAP